MDIEMSRKEKFRYLKDHGVKVAATMKTEQLDEFLDQLEKYQRGEIEEQPTGLASRREVRSRVPLGRMRRKLSTEHLDIPKRYVQRWINDEVGRIDQALEGGYQLVRNPNSENAGEEDLVTNSMGDSVNTHVGVDEEGRPVRAYLMIIDKDLYKEDQDHKQRQLDELDRSIFDPKAPRSEGQYVPKHGIKVDVSH